jgi:hypothetical protein
MSSQAHNQAWPFFSFSNPQVEQKGAKRRKLNNALRLPRRLIFFFFYFK